MFPQPTPDTSTYNGTKVTALGIIAIEGFNAGVFWSLRGCNLAAQQAAGHMGRQFVRRRGILGSLGLAAAGARLAERHEPQGSR